MSCVWFLLALELTTMTTLFVPYINLHDTKKIYLYILYEKWRGYRLLIITSESQKDKAALLRFLINDYFEGSGTTHYTKCKKKKKMSRQLLVRYLVTPSKRA